MATPLIAPRFRAAARAWAVRVRRQRCSRRLGAGGSDGRTLWPWLVVLVAGLPLCAIVLAVHRLPE
jgi:hypothetical protein